MFLIVGFEQVNAIRELNNLSDFWQVDRHFRKEEIDFNNFSWVGQSGMFRQAQICLKLQE